MPDKHEFPINLTLNVEDQVLTDTMVTAVESGMTCVHYWTMVTNVVRDEAYNVQSFNVVKEGRTIPIDRAAILRGMKVVLEGNTRFVGAQIREWVLEAIVTNDAGSIDADAADVIVQCAVFGEVEYG
jgi:hypothetical protein